MELWIKISMDNAAFMGDPDYEIRRILNDAIKHHRIPTTAGSESPLRDINGNEVGFAGVYTDSKILIQRIHEGPY